MERLLTIFENADPFSTWWPTIAAVAVGIVITVRTIMSGQRCPNDNQIKKQIVVVTGGNSGIGFEIAKALAGRGARIILACRNLTAGERAAAIIKRELGCHTPLATAADGGDNINPAERYFVEARHLDLSSFRSVHQFAARLMSEFEHIDVLVNNAGLVFGDTRVPTPDGFEQHSQVNYLAPFLLTQLLLPHLKRAEQGRIVFVSAHAHQAAKIDFDDPLNVGTYAMKFHARDAFAHSKLAVILATRWLAKVLKDTSVTVNCCTPGLVRGTRHLRNSPLMSAFCVKVITYPWMWLFMKNAVEGAQCAIRLATDPQLKQVTGEYFNDCEIAPTSEAGQDKELAKKLYMQTIKTLERVTKLTVDTEACTMDADVRTGAGTAAGNGN
ncbi:LOW QUALITY PROTEIN: retinol dehydrogenase 13 [Drosophila sulfurigaster albostrigata]|uniref:LOW QUALITY PROTEIN: retinol dehydrogenase 13 n=1 Tax=Drosophila sulfurigaster albostrigata TaxID=89887 RepID=UPI002D21B58C|nr:LOW QUALITY PROTEIN: retinol dehydrogenase 13 [Drosophila sulfurigaster albostrigata]